VNNPLAHEWTTGPEIIEAIVSTPSAPSRSSSGKVDVVVAGVGTGGTVTGLSRALKKHNKECIVVGIDPVSRRIFSTNQQIKAVDQLCLERKHPSLSGISQP